MPEADFEELVESDKPPTVTALAEIGKQHRELTMPIPDSIESAKLMRLVTRFVIDAAPIDVEAAMRGLSIAERHGVITRVETAMEWLGGVAAEAMRL